MARARTVDKPGAAGASGDGGAPASAEALQRYWARRDFAKTPEPRGAQAAAGEALSFVIQKHAATRLHYDFRLELDGVLLSWAVPKGPSYDPADKRMAVRTEDHPLSYASFEGTIPPGQYGAGTVIVWDHGTWEPVNDPREGLVQGKLVFDIHGQKMTGRWELVRIAKPGERQDPWLLFKKRDAQARPHSEFDVVTAFPDSVISKPLKPPEPVAAPAVAQPPVKVRSRTPRALGVKVPRLPDTLAPQLATLAAAPPSPAGDWICEIKFDGYRLLARIDGGEVRLLTRNGHDWTAKMPGLARQVGQLGLTSAWLDGEIVVLGDDGVPDFNALQNAFDRSSTQGIVYFLFDVPFLEGRDLRDVPLRARRDRLGELLDGRTGAHLRFSADFGTDATQILESACRMHLEGVIAKRADAPYRSQRSTTWLKLKCQRRQEFVVAGFTERSNAAAEVGSLMLGVHDAAGALLSVGSVGTGWDSEAARRLYRQLVQLESGGPPPFAKPAAGPGRWSRRSAGAERWVEPKMVVEVTFAEWTPDAQIRHAVFVGVRTDKPADTITREETAMPATPPSAPPLPSRTPASGSTGALKVSNPQRVIDASTGATKLDLARYYQSVADWILPHLDGRPVSLVRGPDGIDGQLFFQKHGEKIGIPGIEELDPALWPGHEALLEVRTAAALLGASQLNVIEFHTWNSRARHIDKPDRMVFDLDPGDGVAWPMVQEGALLTRTLLEQLGLQAWLKTSGGKGLHVVVPLAPRAGFDVVKAFSQAIVQHLAQTIPARFVAKSGPANRVGRIFVDYLRNGHGATTATAFSARARPGLGVSMPVAWDDLATLKSGAHWTVATAREHLSFQQTDPWDAFRTTRQGLAAAMKTLGFKPFPGAGKAKK